MTPFLLAAFLTVPLPDGCVPQLQGTAIVCAGQPAPPAPTPPPPAPAPPATIPPGATLLPWNPTGNSRTIVWTCNPAGERRTFYFTVPSNAATPHSISGAEYSDSIGNFRTFTLREVSSGAIIAQGHSTAIQIPFTFGGALGYTVIRRGYTYTLEVVSDATAPYKCNYYIDLNNGG